LYADNNASIPNTNMINSTLKLNSKLKLNSESDSLSESIYSPRFHESDSASQNHSEFDEHDNPSNGNFSSKSESDFENLASCDNDSFHEIYSDDNFSYQKKNKYLQSVSSDDINFDFDDHFEANSSLDYEDDD